jgi:hypothetical protein
MTYLVLPHLRLTWPNQKEASEVFFALTKLFQSKDTNLRRMMYLCIKDICPGADEVIIVTSSLMKDMNSKVLHLSAPHPACLYRNIHWEAWARACCSPSERAVRPLSLSPSSASAPVLASRE